MPPCVRSDTHLAAQARLVAVAIALIACAWPASAVARKKAPPAGPQIAWSNGTKAYVASADSSHVLEGDRVTFVDDTRSVATGTVTHVDAGGLVAVVLDWTVLATVKHPERMRIGFEHPRPRGLPKLTLGAPATTRAGVLWACGSGQLGAMIPPHGYAIVARGTVPFELVRDTTVASMWPDTIVVRTFDDAADEEIALERGEVDAALFWPGELSTHMREQTKWQGSPVATRTRGALVALAVVPGAPELAAPRTPATADSAGLDFLNRFLFRGDLTSLEETPPRWGEARRVVPTLPRAAGAAATLPVVEVERDPACAKPIPIERFFAHPTTGRRPEPTPPSLALFFLDARIRPADSLALAITEHARTSASPVMRARADSLGRLVREHGGAPLTPEALLAGLRDPMGLVRVTPLTCPMLCASEIRAYVQTLGVDALADLIGRMPGGAAP